MANFWSLVTSRLFFIVATLALIAIAVGTAKSWVRRAEVAREVAALKADIRTHQAKNSELEQLLGYLGTDEFKERESRLRLGLQKPGENVVVIPGSVTNGSEAAASTTAVSEPGSNWQRWLNYFFSSPHVAP